MQLWRHRTGRRALVAACLVAGALTISWLTGGGPVGRAGAASLALQPNHLIRTTSGKAAHGHGHGGGGGGSSTCGTGSTSLGWSSSNWSGYAETCSAPYTSVGGSWAVPAVSSPNNSDSAIWIGIDGYNNSDLIQTGTEQDVSSNGAASYAAWWTTSNNQFIEQPITSGCLSGGSACGVVHAGDSITTKISETDSSTSQWTITISDGLAWSFVKVLTYSGPRASAEWIVEAPTVGGRVASLADYQSPLTMNPDSIAPGTINESVSPGLTDSDGGELVVAGRHRSQTAVSVPSFPDSDADGFAISYGSAAPQAPSS
ncbi:MAG: G1 family glutamic endopeptidase [Solirubrobacteraceae bacterium]